MRLVSCVVCMAQGSQPEAAEGSKDGAEASSGPEVQALYSELRRWVDNKNEDPQQALLVANIETSRGRHAVAIRYAPLLDPWTEPVF